MIPSSFAKKIYTLDFIGPSLAILIFATLFARAVLELVYLLPAPVADSILFLDATHNFCTKGLLGTALFSMDPKGLDRYVWHGFLSPWLYAKLNPTCSAPNYFLVNFLLKICSVFLAFWITRQRGLKTVYGCVVAMIVLMIDERYGFRPDPLALLLILGAESALRKNKTELAFAALAALLWTQPTVFGLYTAFSVVLRHKEWLLYLRIGNIAVFFGVSCALALLYPFPVVDLLAGLKAHASMISARRDGGFFSYYMMANLTPGWSLVLLGSLTCLIQRSWRFVILLPIFWWFGPRVPPTAYNLMALLPLILLAALCEAPRRARVALATLSFFVALTGLGQGLARDFATIATYGDTFTAQRDQVLGDRALWNNSLGSVPGFARLWLQGTLPRKSSPIQEDRGEVTPSSVNYVAISGSARSPCPEEAPDTKGSFLFGKKLFNSSSGWHAYRCTTPLRREN